MAPAQSDTWSSLKLFGLVKPSPIMFNLVHRFMLRHDSKCHSVFHFGFSWDLPCSVHPVNPTNFPTIAIWGALSWSQLALDNFVDMNPGSESIMNLIAVAILLQHRPASPGRSASLSQQIWASAKAPTSLVDLVVDVENRWYIPGTYGTNFSWGSWWSNTGTLSNLSTKVSSRGCDVKFVKVQETWNEICAQALNKQ